MYKVFLKIPGVPRPFSVLGNPLFEDERYLVILQDFRKKKILWENILFIEEIDQPLPPSSLETSSIDDEPQIPPQPEPPSETEVTVAFSGATNQLFRIANVPTKLLADDQWSPDLAQIVFTNPQVKAIMGSFGVRECKVDGANITIHTVSNDATEQLKTKLDVVQKFAQTAANLSQPTFSRPTMNLPTDFVMNHSPFEAPISLKGSREDLNAGNREKEDDSEATDNR